MIPSLLQGLFELPTLETTPVVETPSSDRSFRDVLLANHPVDEAPMSRRENETELREHALEPGESLGGNERPESRIADGTQLPVGVAISSMTQSTSLALRDALLVEKVAWQPPVPPRPPLPAAQLDSEEVVAAKPEARVLAPATPILNSGLPLEPELLNLRPVLLRSQSTVSADRLLRTDAAYDSAMDKPLDLEIAKLDAVPGPRVAALANAIEPASSGTRKRAAQIMPATVPGSFGDADPTDVADAKLPRLGESARDVDAMRFADQLAARVATMNVRGSNHAFVRVELAELGRVEIRIQLRSDQANIQFLAQTAAVKDLIEAQMPRLRTMLEESALMLGDVDIGHAEEHGRRQMAQPEQSVRSRLPEDLPSETPSPRTTLARGLIDAYA